MSKPEKTTDMGIERVGAETADRALGGGTAVVLQRRRREQRVGLSGARWRAGVSVLLAFAVGVTAGCTSDRGDDGDAAAGPTA